MEAICRLSYSVADKQHKLGYDVTSDRTAEEQADHLAANLHSAGHNGNFNARLTTPTCK